MVVGTERGSGMAGLTSMANIGREMEKKLAAVGIDSPEKLRELGAEQAFARLKRAYPRVCLVHLYSLEGAVKGIPFDCLSAERKRELKGFSDSLKG